VKILQSQLKQKLVSFASGQKQSLKLGAAVERFGKTSVAPRPENVLALKNKFSL